MKKGDVVNIKPINNRFKNLIAKWGTMWIAASDARAMHCFNGEVGITCRPQDCPTKLSNFKLDDIR